MYLRRNGSTFETLIFTMNISASDETLETRRVELGLKNVEDTQQNSAERRNPKKAVVKAAHSITFSFSA